MLNSPQFPGSLGDGELGDCKLQDLDFNLPKSPGLSMCPSSTESHRAVMSWTFQPPFPVYKVIP